MASNPGPLGQMVPVRMKGNPKCATHRDNDVVLVCQKCQELICVSCSISTHKSHIDSFVELSNIIQQEKPILQEFIDETESEKLPQLQQQIQVARKDLTENQQNFKGFSTNMKEHFEKCRLELERLIEEHDGSHWDQMEKRNEDLLKRRVAQLEERFVSLVKLSTDCKSTLQSGTDVLVHDSVSDIQKYDADNPQIPKIDMPQFPSGTDVQQNMKRALGLLDLDIPTDHQPQCPTADQCPAATSKLTSDSNQTSGQPTSYKLRDNPRVISQISCPYRLTAAIRPTADGHAWLRDSAPKRAFLIDVNGKTVKTIKHSCTIQDISVDPTTGHLWFCCPDKTVHEVSSSVVLHVVTRSSFVTRFTTDHDPYSLCVTRDGRVVVGMHILCRPYKVGVYTKDGVLLHSTTGEDIGSVAPYSITQCPITSNIALVNVELLSGDGSDPDDCRRHIVVFTEKLSVLYHYWGADIKKRQVMIRTPGTFAPRSIAYDSRGNIVISDWRNKTIELISGAGHHIKTLHSGLDQGELGLQTGDVLWSDMIPNPEHTKEIRVLQYYTG